MKFLQCFGTIFPHYYGFSGVKTTILLRKFSSETFRSVIRVWMDCQKVQLNTRIFKVANHFLQIFKVSSLLGLIGELFARKTTIDCQIIGFVPSVGIVLGG